MRLPKITQHDLQLVSSLSATKSNDFRPSAWQVRDEVKDRHRLCYSESLKGQAVNKVLSRVDAFPGRKLTSRVRWIVPARNTE